jgi:hypothetical protein
VKEGKLLQELFDKDNVKYNKRNQIKDSGLDETHWSPDNNFVYAVGSSGRILFWDVIK